MFFYPLKHQGLLSNAQAKNLSRSFACAWTSLQHLFYIYSQWFHIKTLACELLLRCSTDGQSYEIRTDLWMLDTQKIFVEIFWYEAKISCSYSKSWAFNWAVQEVFPIDFAQVFLALFIYYPRWFLCSCRTDTFALSWLSAVASRSLNIQMLDATSFLMLTMQIHANNFFH